MSAKKSKEEKAAGADNDAKLNAIYADKSLHEAGLRIAAMFTRTKPNGEKSGGVKCHDFFMHPVFFDSGVQKVLKLRHYSTAEWKNLPDQFRRPDEEHGDSGFPLNAFESVLNCIEGRPSPLLARFIEGDPVFMGQLIEAMGKVLNPAKFGRTLDFAIREACCEVARRPLERIQVAGESRFLVRSLSLPEIEGLIRKKYRGKLGVTLDGKEKSVKKIGSEVSRIRKTDMATRKYWKARIIPGCSFSS